MEQHPLEAGPRAYRWQEVAVLEGGCPGLKYCEHYIPLRSQLKHNGKDR
uniref:Uncharacterized protein n=1 Tax=Oryza meridionalis TaxID=40149 RepID=A0A0E0BWB4_9ORYZ